MNMPTNNCLYNKSVLWLVIVLSVFIAQDLQPQDFDPNNDCVCETGSFEPANVLAENDLIAIGKVVRITNEKVNIHHGMCSHLSKSALAEAVEHQDKHPHSGRLSGLNINGSIVSGSCDAMGYEITAFIPVIHFEFEYLKEPHEGSLVVKQLFNSPCNNKFEPEESYLVIANHTDTYLRFSDPDGYAYANNIRTVDNSVMPHQLLDNTLRKDYLITNICKGTKQISDASVEIAQLRASSNP